MSLEEIFLRLTIEEEQLRPIEQLEVSD